MSEPHEEGVSVMICGGRRRGRPRVTPGDSLRLSVRIWSEHYDALYKNASAKRMELADYLRAVLEDAAERRV